jgi:hypothetical protein
MSYYLYEFLLKVSLSVTMVRRISPHPDRVNLFRVRNADSNIICKEKLFFSYFELGSSGSEPS